MSTYDPRSIYQSYAQYGRNKKKQSANKKKNTGLGSSRMQRANVVSSPKIGSGRGDSIVEGPNERANAMKDNRPLAERIDTAFVQTILDFIPNFNTDAKKEEPKVVAMQVYGRPEFTIPKQPTVTATPLPPTTGMNVGANFGTSMGIDPVSGRDFRDLPQNTYSKTMEGIVSGTGGRDGSVVTASPRKPGIMEAGAQFGPGKPEDPPIDSLINTITTGPKKPGLGQQSTTYKVKKGDTLSEIAKAYGTTVERLVNINDLEDKSGDTILAGQTLKIIPDAPTVSEPTEATEAAETFTADNVDFDFIADLEGAAINEAYVPQKDGVAIDQSGVTIGTGVDLGSKNEAYFKDLDDGIVEKLKPYLGKKKQAAINILATKPLTLSDAEIAELDRYVKEKELKTLKDQWDKDSDVKFEDLPTNKATTVAATFYQHGTQMFDYDYWDQTTGGDWEAARDNLRDFNDKNPLFDRRRQREANYLESGEL